MTRTGFGFLRWVQYSCILWYKYLGSRLKPVASPCVSYVARQLAYCIILLHHRAWHLGYFLLDISKLVQLLLWFKQIMTLWVIVQVISQICQSERQTNWPLTLSKQGIRKLKWVSALHSVLVHFCVSNVSNLSLFFLPTAFSDSEQQGCGLIHTGCLL